MTMISDPQAWRLWLRQVLAIAWLELRKCFRGKRLIGITLLNLAPVAILLLTYLIPDEEFRNEVSPAKVSAMYAVLFATYMMRAGIFFTSAALTIQLFRNETLEKTLHYYLLAPVRRQVLVIGKFLAASLASSIICGTAVVAAYLVMFGHLKGSLGTFMFSGPGLVHLFSYLGVTVLGCLGYGAVFALFGILWRNPIISALLLFGWESVLFLLPPFLKLATVAFYLESLLPYRPDVGPLAILAEPPPAFASIFGMLVFAALVLVLAGWRATRMEIAYSTD